MNGAQALVATLLAGDVDVCFANPGTSEMHFVAALDEYPQMRCILCLFEGGATGAADAYARMTGKPAATLLHLGPGFANGWSNLHNARKSCSPVINIVGDHAGYHLKHDAPLQADLDGVAASVSHWTRRSLDANGLPGDGAEAIRAARSHGGQIATLVLPADSAWSECDAESRAPLPVPALHLPDEGRITAAARALEGEGAALYVGGPGLHGEGALLAGRIAARTGCRLLAPFFAARIERGESAVAFEQLPYFADDAAAFLHGVSHMTCVGVAPPVNFFAYPGKRSTPEPSGTTIDRLTFADWDTPGTLEGIARAAGVDGSETLSRIGRLVPEQGKGRLTPDAMGRELARQIPEGAIMVNEAVTASGFIWPHIDRAARHDRINNTGGSIGQGLPSALGAAVACPDRPVFALSGDGSAMYQLQVLWTMAREKLDVTVIILANRGYQILHVELAAQGAKPGRNSSRMFDVVDPELDWVALARGHGVEGRRAETAEDFASALAEARASPGPFLIEARI